jgi:hypothetical protein
LLAYRLLFKPTADELALAKRRSSFESLRDQEDKDGFQERSKHAERFFHEKRANQWKDVLTQQQVNVVVNAHGEPMKRFGYLH